MDMGMHDLILDGTKIGLYRERVEAWQRGERVAPITVDMALTRACNLRCIYCYGQLQENERKPLTAEIISRTMRDFAEIGVKGVSFVSDGESTCSPHLLHAVFEAHNNGLATALGTNGVLLTKHQIHSLLNYLSYLRFNISAGEETRYNEIMRPPDATAYRRVIENIKLAVAWKKQWGLPCTIGMQMVLMPEFTDQIMPLSRLAIELGVDYLVIKHCSDDEEGALKINYNGYNRAKAILRMAEWLSTDTTKIIVKWSKIEEGSDRTYSRCYAPPFIIQLSGSGLVAPCGMLFASKYKAFHIGNICDTPFKEIWQSDRYWSVMEYLASRAFNAQTMCGSLCLQHTTNKALHAFKTSGTLPEVPECTKHKEFL